MLSNLGLGISEYDMNVSAMSKEGLMMKTDKGNAYSGSTTMKCVR